MTTRMYTLKTHLDNARHTHPLLFWETVAVIAVYILGAVYHPWEWRQLNQFEQIVFSGIGELAMMMVDIDVFCKTKAPDIDPTMVWFCIYAVFGWLNVIKNLTLKRKFMDKYDLSRFEEIISDCFFDIIFSYITSIIIYALIPIFLALDDEYLIPLVFGSLISFLISSAILIVFIFPPSFITFLRFGLLCAIYPFAVEKIPEIFTTITFTTFPMSLLTPVLVGIVSFLIGCLLDILATLVLKLFFGFLVKMSEDTFLEKINKILYYMI